jgi:DNA repair exonuclease SbcCD ATPase subunit
MTTVRIAIPIYKCKNFDTLSEQGILEVATLSDTDTLSESYEKLKPQIAELMDHVQSESQIVVELQQVQNQLLEKKKAVRNLYSKIERANRQLERLTRFLAAFGIRASDINLNITTAAIAYFLPVEVIDISEDNSEEVENDPIPFNCLDNDDNPHEF